MEDAELTALYKELGIEDEPDEAEELQEEVEQQFSKADEKARRATKAVGEVLAKHLKEEEAEKIYNSFMAEASDTAKEIYAVLADEEMTPSQMKKVVDAAQRKAAAIDEKLNPKQADSADGEPSEDVQKLAKEEAKKIAAREWGSGPVSGDSSNSEEEELKRKYEAASKGDLVAGLSLLMTAPSTSPLPR
jgi:hypothetical protein